ncbi:MAG: MopE-related protein, partial [Myxococcales bacterium]|nr:MopE-related protein [Myxococcales bacterium]
AANPSTPETCDDGIDNDCDGTVDNPSTWYAECDGDGFASLGAPSIASCTEPASSMLDCGGSPSQWTSIEPVADSTADCRDNNALAFPGQTAWQTSPLSTGIERLTYDYNCDGIDERRYTALSGGIFLSCSVSCVGTSYWRESSVPACGSMGTLSRCVFRLGGCVRDDVETTQSCR